MSLQLPYADLADPHTQHWPLVASGASMLLLVAAYLLLVRYLPRWMAKRSAYKLKPLLVAYNLLMALLNAHILRELWHGALALRYNFLCQPYKPPQTATELRVAAAIWWFYFSKCLEFADTIFFILRKRWQQLSFLHVYHHATMFPLWWIAVKWVPTGSTFFPALINATVHVLMYGYYALSALGIRVWWKRHLTTLQLVQFSLGLLWGLQAIARDCAYPHWICWTMSGYMISFLLLFGRFYVQSYLQPAPRRGRKPSTAAAAAAVDQIQSTAKSTCN